MDTIQAQEENSKTSREQVDLKDSCGAKNDKTKSKWQRQDHRVLLVVAQIQQISIQEVKSRR